MRRWTPGSRAFTARLSAISIGIAVVLGIAVARGSWFADDLDLLVYGNRGFSPAVLFAPANDHVVPGLRFVYAVFAEFGNFSYGFTVVWRCVVLALNIFLAGSLLYRLVGNSVWALLGAAWYGLSPLMLQAFAQLSAGVNDVHAQLFCLVLLHAAVDWFGAHRRRALLVGPVALALVLSFWLKAGLVLTTALALGWVVSRVGLRRRLLDSVLWGVTMLAPVVAYAAVILPRRRAGTARWPGWDVEGRLLFDSVRESALMPFVGGPWRWTDTPPYGFADPPLVAQVVGAAVCAVLVVLAARRHPRVLLLWVSAVIFVVVTVVLVSVGRYFQFGSSLTRHYHYWSDLGLPLLLATVLTLERVLPWPVDPLRRMSAAGVRAMLRRRPMVGVLVAAWFVGAAVSHVAFDAMWGRNPAPAYFATMRAEVERAGSPPNVWDTPVPTTIAPFINEHRRLGEILAVAHIDVRFQQPDSEPRIFDDRGRLRTADFRVWARGEVPPDCRLRLEGAGSVSVPLDHPLPDANWYVRMAYLANPDARVRVELVDRRTDTTSVLTSHTRAWPSGLLTAYLNDPLAVVGKPATELRLTSVDPSTSLCVGTTEVGLVVPAG